MLHGGVVLAGVYNLAVGTIVEPQEKVIVIIFTTLNMVGVLDNIVRKRKEKTIIKNSNRKRVINRAVNSTL